MVPRCFLVFAWHRLQRILTYLNKQYNYKCCITWCSRENVNRTQIQINTSLESQSPAPSLRQRFISVFWAVETTIEHPTSYFQENNPILFFCVFGELGEQQWIKHAAAFTNKGGTPKALLQLVLPNCSWEGCSNSQVIGSSMVPQIDTQNIQKLYVFPLQSHLFPLNLDFH